MGDHFACMSLNVYRIHIGEIEQEIKQLKCSRIGLVELVNTELRVTCANRKDVVQNFESTSPHLSFPFPKILS